MPSFDLSIATSFPRPSLHTAPVSGRAALDRMLTAIDSVVRSGGPATDKRVAAVLAGYATIPDLLDGVDCTPSRSRYTRALLEDGRSHCVLALVWGPGQVSPVHGHRTWCALAVQRGVLIETNFRHGDGGLHLTGSRSLHAGDVSHEPARTGVHRIASLGASVAISLHVYGTSYDRLGVAVNDVRAA